MQNRKSKKIIIRKNETNERKTRRLVSASLLGWCMYIIGFWSYVSPSELYVTPSESYVTPNESYVTPN